ncbi:MAG: hypothetical protein JXR90_17875, partial [Spirochaetes bacterium]|nr:hypothetical protein [Spirochaetota bacterium]
MKKYAKLFISLIASVILAFVFYACSDCSVDPSDEGRLGISIELTPGNSIFKNDSVQVDISVDDIDRLGFIEAYIDGQLYKLLNEEPFNFKIKTNDGSPDTQSIKAIAYDNENITSLDSTLLNIFNSSEIRLIYEKYIPLGSDMDIGIRAAEKDTVESISYSLWKNGQVETDPLLSDVIEIEPDQQFCTKDIVLATSEFTETGRYDFSVTMQSSNTVKTTTTEDGFFTLYDNSILITNITADPDTVTCKGTSQITCEAISIQELDLTYEWSSESGQIAGEGSTITWTAPETEGDYDISVKVKDGTDSVSTSISVAVVQELTPTITADPLSLTFGSVEAGSTKDMTFALGGTALTNDVVVTGLTGYTLSKDGTTFANNLIYTAADAMTGQTVTVRFAPEEEQAYNGNIILTSTGVAQVDVTVTGAGIPVPPNNAPVISSITGDPTSVIQGGTSDFTCI